MIEKRGEAQAHEGSYQAQHTTADSAEEIGFQKNRDGHRDPVAALGTNAARNRITYGHTNSQADGMTENDRAEGKVRAENGQAVAQSTKPDFAHAGGRDVLGRSGEALPFREANGGTELPV